MRMESNGPQKAKKDPSDNVQNELGFWCVIMPFGVIRLFCESCVSDNFYFTQVVIFPLQSMMSAGDDRLFPPINSPNLKINCFKLLILSDLSAV